MKIVWLPDTASLPQNEAFRLIEEYDSEGCIEEGKIQHIRFLSNNEIEVVQEMNLQDSSYIFLIDSIARYRNGML